MQWRFCHDFFRFGCIGTIGLDSSNRWVSCGTVLDGANFFKLAACTVGLWVLDGRFSYHSREIVAKIKKALLGLHDGTEIHHLIFDRGRPAKHFWLCRWNRGLIRTRKSSGQAFLGYPSVFGVCSRFDSSDRLGSEYGKKRIRRLFFMVCNRRRYYFTHCGFCGPSDNHLHQTRIEIFCCFASTKRSSAIPLV